MIFDAMESIRAEGALSRHAVSRLLALMNCTGVAMCEAHPDPEVFRLRLGKALNYEYNEDSQTGLFQRRDPREGEPSAHYHVGHSL